MSRLAGVDRAVHAAGDRLPASPRRRGHAHHAVQPDPLHAGEPRPDCQLRRGDSRRPRSSAPTPRVGVAQRRRHAPAHQDRRRERRTTCSGMPRTTRRRAAAWSWGCRCPRSCGASPRRASRAGSTASTPIPSARTSCTGRSVSDLAVQRDFALAARGPFRRLRAVLAFDNVGDVAVVRSVRTAAAGADASPDHDRCGRPGGVAARGASTRRVDAHRPRQRVEQGVEVGRPVERRHERQPRQRHHEHLRHPVQHHDARLAMHDVGVGIHKMRGAHGPVAVVVERARAPQRRPRAHVVPLEVAGDHQQPRPALEQPALDADRPNAPHERREVALARARRGRRAVPRSSRRSA